MSSSSMTTTPNSFLLQKTPTHHHRNPRLSVTCSAASPRLINFAAGPATLPEPVLRKAQAELFTWADSGMSVMEMSHRGKDFLSIIQKAESDLRKLLGVPEDYSVLFLQGGASSQFSAVPLNLCKGKEDVVDFVVTGSWGDKAFKEGGKYCKPNLVWSGKSDKYTNIPSFEGCGGDKVFKEGGKCCKPNLVWSGKADKYTNIPAFESLPQTPNAKYLHICANETIHGVEFKNYPTVAGDGVLVADMSSNFCSKPVDVSKFGIIYAGAQKNVGPSGVTIVIIRKDLIGKAQDITPVMFEYKIHDENNSLYNTPPCYNIYMCGLVFEDLLAQGGLAEVEKKNEKKAKILYDAIDGSGGFYKCPVEKSVRSLMNVPFTMAKSELEGDFIKEAAKENMVQLKGHRSVGGMRASIYNAMPLAGVEKLVAFMKDFQAKHA